MDFFENFLAFSIIQIYKVYNKFYGIFFRLCQKTLRKFLSSFCMPSGVQFNPAVFRELAFCCFSAQNSQFFRCFWYISLAFLEDMTILSNFGQNLLNILTIQEKRVREIGFFKRFFAKSQFQDCMHRKCTESDVFGAFLPWLLAFFKPPRGKANFGLWLCGAGLAVLVALWCQACSAGLAVPESWRAVPESWTFSLHGGFYPTFRDFEAFFALFFLHFLPNVGGISAFIKKARQNR